MDEEELYAVLIFLVQGVEGADLRPEGRSSIAAEDQGHRLLGFELGQANAFLGMQVISRKSGAGSPGESRPSPWSISRITCSGRGPVESGAAALGLC